MSDQSARLGLPFLAAAQAQKHVTVNESLLRLDALAQLSVRSARVSMQPTDPLDGDIYLLPGGKTGSAWGGMADGALAYYRDGVWEELSPKRGWLCFAEDEDALYARAASAWRTLAAANERRLLFTPGGDGQVSIYRIDAQRVQNPRSATIGAVANDVITITTTDAGLFFNDAYMSNVSYVRIWNMSKTPNQPAWVRRQPANNQLQVVDGTAIAAWTSGDLIQIGDPTNQTPNRVIALDISPMMQNVLGRVFPQSGVQLKALVEGIGTQAILDTSESGQTGSFNSVRSETTGPRLSSQYIQSSSHPSPMSSSNLIFIRESAAAGGLGLTILTAVGVWV